MPVAARVQSVYVDLGRRAAKGARGGGTAWPRCPYPDDTDAQRAWLEGWYSVRDIPPLAYEVQGRPPENDGLADRLKAGSAPGLNMMRGRVRITRDVQIYRAANANKDQAHQRKRARGIAWTPANVDLLQALYDEGLEIPAIALQMRTTPKAVQKQGYRMGLSWSGRGLKGGG